LKKKVKQGAELTLDEKLSYRQNECLYDISILLQARNNRELTDDECIAGILHSKSLCAADMSLIVEFGNVDHLGAKPERLVRDEQRYDEKGNLALSGLWRRDE